MCRSTGTLNNWNHVKSYLLKQHAMLFTIRSHVTQSEEQAETDVLLYWNLKQLERKILPKQHAILFIRSLILTLVKFVRSLNFP